MHACPQLFVRKAMNVQGLYTWSGEVLGLSFEGKFVRLIKFSNRNGLQQWNGLLLWMNEEKLEVETAYRKLAGSVPWSEVSTG
jgi:hypothetical protein